MSRKNNAISHSQELAAARNAKPRRPRTLSPAAQAAQQRLRELTAKLREGGHFPQIVLERHGLSK